MKTIQEIRSTLLRCIDDNQILMPDITQGRSISGFNEPMDGAIVVRPKSTQEVSDIVKICNGSDIKLIPLGGCTSMAGGLRRMNDEIYISFELMNRIEKLDPGNRVAIVQAGVVLQSLQETVEEHALDFALDLGSRGTAQIGGLLSCNAGGEKAFRWGMAREQVLGIEVVLANGDVLNLCNEMIKNNAGYDLKHLFIGSEGTLGLITKASLRLRPKITESYSALATVKDFESVLRLRKRVEDKVGNSLTAFEVMWPEFYQIVNFEKNATLPLPITENFYALFDVEFGEAMNKEIFEESMSELFEECLIDDMAIAYSTKDKQAVWAIRNDIETLIKAMSPLVAFDISLPTSKMDAISIAIQNSILEWWPDARFVRFGHIGDNNLHLAITIGSDTPSVKEQIEDIVYAHTKLSGGSFSAEHGIGLDKKDAMYSYTDSNVLSLMSSIKYVLDPQGTLNPGKVV